MQRGGRSLKIDHDGNGAFSKISMGMTIVPDCNMIVTGLTGYFLTRMS